MNKIKNVTIDMHSHIKPFCGTCALHSKWCVHATISQVIPSEGMHATNNMLTIRECCNILSQGITNEEVCLKSPIQ